VSWQIIPSVLGKLITDHKSGNAKKAFEAMLQMTKIDIEKLKQAYNQA
jgi:predicted 3-demethylubiquinone-9 3-methyltransferase (glyoxalase superfamily)